MKIIGVRTNVLLSMLVSVGMASAVNAQSVSRLMHQSNVLADAINYPQATIDDHGMPDDIFLTGTSPTGWSVSKSKSVDGFGSFTTALSGRGGHRADPPTFSTTGISDDSITTNATLSTVGNSVPLNAKVKGLRDHHVRGGSFGGGTNPVTPSSAVPLPAAVTLFGSGLIGLAGIAARNRRRDITERNV